MSLIERFTLLNSSTVYKDPESQNFDYSELALAAGLSLMSTALFTSVQPIHGALFITVALSVMYFSKDFFAEQFECYKTEEHKNDFMAYVGTAAHLGTAFVIANLICTIFFRALAFRQMAWLACTSGLTISTVKWLRSTS